MKEVAFNVPRNPYDDHVDFYTENDVSNDEYRIINAFSERAARLGYFKNRDTCHGEALRIYRTGGIESLKEILQKKPYLLGTMRDEYGGWPSALYSLIDVFVDTLKPKKIYEVNIDVRSWALRTDRENVYGNSSNKNLVELYIDYYKIPSSIQIGKLGEVNHNPYIGKIDLVVAIIPLAETRDLDTALSEVEKLLSKNGKILLLSREAAVEGDTSSALEHFGLHVEATLNFPTEVFHPNISLNSFFNRSTELIVLSRDRTDFIFTGQFANEASHNAELLSNLFEGRKKGRLPELGTLTHQRKYVSCLNVIDGAKFRQAAKHQKYPGVLLTSLLRPKGLITEVSLTGGYDPVNDGDLDALFLNSSSLTLLSDTRVEEMVAESQVGFIDAIRIPLDTQKVFLPFLRMYWSSPLNQLALRSIPRSLGLLSDCVSVEYIKELVLYLPPFSEQVRRFELSEAVNRAKSEAEQLQEGIWSGDLTLNEFSARVTALQSGNDLSYWIAQLPSPLARILNRYATSDEVSTSSEHLYHFFEACAEYIVCVSITFLQQQSIDYKEIITAFKVSGKPDSKRQLGATFGTWTHMLSKLIALVKTLYEDDKLTSSTFPRELITLLLNPDFFKTLEDARILRNKRSHGGFIDGEDAKNRLKELEALMQGNRYELVGAFSSSSLLYLVESRRKRNKYYIRFQDCRGASDRLPSKEIEHPVDLPDGLHLSFKDQIFPLAPLVQYEEGAGIFTFFNSLNQDNVTIVNYAHGDYSSRVINDEEMSASIAQIFGLEI